MNHTKEFNSKPYSNFTQKEKNKILNNNYQFIYKYVTENCNDYRLIRNSIEKWGINMHLILMLFFINI